MIELEQSPNEKMYSSHLMKISEEMKHSYPVFIVGAPRSGTSILYRTLQKHSVFRPQKINLTEPQMFYYSNRSYLLENEMYENPLDYMLYNHKIYTRFLASIKKIRLMHRAVNMIFGYKSINIKFANRVKLWWYFNLNHLVLRSFYYFATKARAPNRLVEKSPGNLAHSKKLLLAFPKAKLLYIYRHPIDVYSSYIKRSKIEHEARWTQLSADNFSDIYKKNTWLALKLNRKMKDNFILVRYEDFTKKTDIEFKKICGFLKIPFENEAIIETKPDLTKWHVDPYLFGKITHKTKKWQDYISFESAKYIETQLSKEMKVLNYERYTNQH